MNKTIIKINDLTCVHCKISIEKAFLQIQDVSNVVVNIETKEVIIEGDINIKKIKTLLEKLGYSIAR